MNASITYLEWLEAEAIEITREVMCAAKSRVMLYSVGKDSAVTLHLAKKMFYPSHPQFPLMHLDTTWKFQQVYKLHDKVAKHAGKELINYQKAEAKTRSGQSKNFKDIDRPYEVLETPEIHFSKTKMDSDQAANSIIS